MQFCMDDRHVPDGSVARTVLIYRRMFGRRFARLSSSVRVRGFRICLSGRGTVASAEQGVIAANTMANFRGINPAISRQLKGAPEMPGNESNGPSDSSCFRSPTGTGRTFQKSGHRFRRGPGASKYILPHQCQSEMGIISFWPPYNKAGSRPSETKIDQYPYTSMPFNVRNFVYYQFTPYFNAKDISVDGSSYPLGFPDGAAVPASARSVHIVSVDGLSLGSPKSLRGPLNPRPWTIF